MQFRCTALELVRFEKRKELEGKELFAENFEISHTRQCEEAKTSASVCLLP